MFTQREDPLAFGVFGALGPFFLAGLLSEKTGIWLTRKNDRTAQLAAACVIWSISP
ncbi:MAG: hypothetical protein QOF58_1937 [Pseudonocardiales bacterium]|jgi:hypothetical protein|nr:hypothetical protein [Pseudonocardiales bacterium]